MKVNWLIPTQERNYNHVLASIWIRCLQLIPFLEQLGVECVINEPFSDAPIYYFVRWQNDEAYQIASQAKRRGKKIIFDLVVNYFDESHATLGRLRIEECLRFVELAHVVTTCSQFIANRAADYHAQVVYLPDSINLRHFQGTKRPEDFFRPKLRLIWSGNHSKIHELEPIFPIARQCGFDMLVISNKHPAKHRWRWFNSPYQFKRWRYESFPSDILTGDLCISHRDSHTVYNQGHSFFKIGVMMALGLPVIASAVPSYTELLNHKTGAGWICTSLDEWRKTFRQLKQNRQQLATASHNAQKAIAPFTTRCLAPRYHLLFQHLLLET